MSWGWPQWILAVMYSIGFILNFTYLLSDKEIIRRRKEHYMRMVHFVLVTILLILGGFWS